MWKQDSFAILLLLCLLAMASGQQPSGARQQPGKEEPDVVRITTNLVQIDALVTDKRGKQISDLRPEEFQIFQDGRLQQVTGLSYISTSGSEKPKPAASAGSGKNNPALVPSVPLRPEQVHRTIALVVDDLALSFVSTAFVRKTLTRYVNEQMQPGDLVAIIRTSAGAGPLQQFTADKRQLLAAID
jgi:VWFA-related protein